MLKNICIINGHPYANRHRFVAGLCDAYAEGAAKAGHGVSRINIGELDLSFLESAADFATPPGQPVLDEREKILAADHLVLAFPLWLGSMPSKARAFFEQAARGDFFLNTMNSEKAWPKRMMKGRSARIIVTMGMPGLVYKTLMDGGALKAIERGMLGMSGFKPIHHTILGGVESATDHKRHEWLSEAREMGHKGH
jgi:putative NADPH-quinone reductase